MNIATPDNPLAVLGHNQPPEPVEPTPFEIAEKAVNDIYGEAKLWLDGAKVEDQNTADGMGNLLTVIRKAKALAEESRKVEKKPHDDAAKEVQARYVPLIEKADLAAAACKKALTPWLEAQEKARQEAARIAQEAADKKRREAEEAIRATDATNLEERAAAESLLKDAKKAEKVAASIDRQTSNAGGYMGRAIGLKSVWSATMTDPVLAARHFWTQPDTKEELTAFVQGLADKAVRAGIRTIPGFDIAEHKEAV